MYVMYFILPHPPTFQFHLGCDARESTVFLFMLNRFHPFHVDVIETCYRLWKSSVNSLKFIKRLHEWHRLTWIQCFVFNRGSDHVSIFFSSIMLICLLLDIQNVTKLRKFNDIFIFEFCPNFVLSCNFSAAATSLTWIVQTKNQSQ